MLPILLILIIFALILFRLSVPRLSPPPDTLGLDENGRLAPCPDIQGCVSTQATRQLHAIDPFSFSGDLAVAQQKMVTLLTDLPEATIITNQPGYIHAEFRSRVFRLIDDVEFSFEQTDGEIQFRSSLRLGYGDIGANRNRMERIRQLWDGTTSS